MTEAAEVFAKYTYRLPPYQSMTHDLVLDARSARGWSLWDLYKLDGMSMVWVAESVSGMGLPNAYQPPPTRPPR